MIGCLVADVKDVTELAPLLFVPQLLFAGNQSPLLFFSLLMADSLHLIFILLHYITWYLHIALLPYLLLLHIPLIPLLACLSSAKKDVNFTLFV